MMLQAVDLACRRGEQVVFAGLSFTAEPGSALLLKGRNGAGKSSLLRILAGLLRPVEGQLLWAGLDAFSDRSEHAARLRYLGHQDAVKGGLSVTENLAIYARLWGCGPHAVAPALAAVGLGALARLPGRVLSAGQKRRLALARLVLRPVPLWLLDEPTLGLDTASVEALGGLMEKHRAQGGIVVAATHLPLPLADTRDLAM